MNMIPVLLIGKMTNTTTKDIRLGLINPHTIVKRMAMNMKIPRLLVVRNTKGMIHTSQIRTTDKSLPPTWWADVYTALVGETQ